MLRVEPVPDTVLGKFRCDNALRFACRLRLLEHPVYGVVDVVDLLHYILFVICSEGIPAAAFLWLMPVGTDHLYIRHNDVPYLFICKNTFFLRYYL